MTGWRTEATTDVPGTSIEEAVEFSGVGVAIEKALSRFSVHGRERERESITLAVEAEIAAAVLLAQSLAPESAFLLTAAALIPAS